MISRKLSATLGNAVKLAKNQRHEYVCVEHVLHAILKDARGVEIIEACGGNIDSLMYALGSFFEQRIEHISPDDSNYVLHQTIGFQRVIQRAVNHVRSAEKEVVEVEDILASIFLEKDSHAAYFLNEAGITRLDVLSYISHATPDTHLKESLPKKPSKSKKARKKRINPLKAFTVDLVQRASQGKLDPLIGRMPELDRTIQV